MLMEGGVLVPQRPRREAKTSALPAAVVWAKEAHKEWCYTLYYVQCSARFHSLSPRIREWRLTFAVLCALPLSLAAPLDGQ